MKFDTPAALRALLAGYVQGKGSATSAELLAIVAEEGAASDEGPAALNYLVSEGRLSRANDVYGAIRAPVSVPIEQLAKLDDATLEGLALDPADVERVMDERVKGEEAAGRENAVSA